MKDGWIQQVGEPLELYGKPANKFVAGFIGSPAMNFAEVTVSEEGGQVFVTNPGLRCAVGPARAERMRAYKGQTVTLGVRPEDMHIAAGEGRTGFDALVEVVEPLGSEILLDVKIGSAVMVARVEPTVRAKVHEKIRLNVEPDRLHFFDGKTEVAI
jgi:multiple sugar transport system ATP-binding protein